MYEFWNDYVKQKVMLHGYRQLYSLHKNIKEPKCTKECVMKIRFKSEDYENCLEQLN